MTKTADVIHVDNVSGETTNKFLNENALEVLNNLKDALEDAFSALYLGVLIDPLFNKVPMNQLFKMDWKWFISACVLCSSSLISKTLLWWKTKSVDEAEHEIIAGVA